MGIVKWVNLEFSMQIQWMPVILAYVNLYDLPMRHPVSVSMGGQMFLKLLFRGVILWRISICKKKKIHQFWLSVELIFHSALFTLYDKEIFSTKKYIVFKIFKFNSSLDHTDRVCRRHAFNTIFWDDALCGIGIALCGIGIKS